MNAELVKKALEKVGNSSVLVNLVSRRVRQLGYHEGFSSRSLVMGAENLRASDIALREIIEDKMGWEIPEIVPLTRPVRKRARNRHDVRPG
jgi:DNA-directed RNA polymerase subunit K/omega